MSSARQENLKGAAYALAAVAIWAGWGRSGSRNCRPASL